MTYEEEELQNKMKSQSFELQSENLRMRRIINKVFGKSDLMEIEKGDIPEFKAILQKIYEQDIKIVKRNRRLKERNDFLERFAQNSKNIIEEWEKIKENLELTPELSPTRKISISSPNMALLSISSISSSSNDK